MIEALVVVLCLLIAPFALIGRREYATEQDLMSGHMKSCSHNGNTIAFRDSGMGHCVVLIHGFGSWLRTWDRLQEALVQSGYRVIAIDLVGTGASSRSLRAQDYTTGAQARMVTAVLDQIGVATCTVIGHSYGGRVALQMAIYEPQRIVDVIALAPETHATTRPAIAKIVGFPVLGYALAFWSLSPRLMRMGLTSVCKRTHWLTSARVDAYAAPLSVRGHLAAQLVQSSAAKDSDMPVPRHFAYIQVSVHLIWGQHDPVFPASDGVKMVDQMRNCDLSLIPNCGHIPHEEAFDETLALVHQHLPPRTVMIPTLH